MYIKNLGLGTNKKEYQMEYLTEENLIILWTIGFTAHMSYMFGRYIGIGNTIDYFAEKGYIDLDDD